MEILVTIYQCALTAQDVKLKAQSQTIERKLSIQNYFFWQAGDICSKQSYCSHNTDLVEEKNMYSMWICFLIYTKQLIFQAKPLLVFTYKKFK